MGQRLVPFGLAACVFLVLVPSTADARTWTDRKGNQIRGEFVRIHEGEVILKQAGKVGRYPFHEFSQEDQDYVREALEAKGQGHLVPPKVGGGSAGRPVVGEGEGTDGEASEPDIEREWTDKTGRTMEVRFVGMSGDNVKFIKDGQEVSFAFFDFSLADQNYLKALLVSQGRESQIPNRQSGSGFSPMEGMPGGMEEMYGDMEGMPGGSGYPGASGGPSGYPRPPRVSVLPPSVPTQPSYTPPSYTPPSIPSASDHASGPEFEKEVYYYCTGCNATLPSSVGVGDRCPSCGVYFAYGEDEFGNRTAAKPGKHTMAFSILLVVVGTIVALVALATKISGS